MTHLTTEELDSLRARLVGRTDPRALTALTRLRNDDFGLCVRCGDELEFLLLDVAPDRVLCESCDDEARRGRESSRHGICGMKQP